MRSVWLLFSFNSFRSPHSFTFFLSVSTDWKRWMVNVPIKKTPISTINKRYVQFSSSEDDANRLFAWISSSRNFRRQIFLSGGIFFCMNQKRFDLLQKPEWRFLKEYFCERAKFCTHITISIIIIRNERENLKINWNFHSLWCYWQSLNY